MNRKIILFGAILSTFILILVPSISSVNANIQNKNNLNMKNIDIEDIKRIKNRILSNDCNCQKPNDSDSNESGFYYMCWVLWWLFWVLASPLILMELEGLDYTILYKVLKNLFIIGIQPLLMLADFLDCFWRIPDE